MPRSVCWPLTRPTAVFELKAGRPEREQPRCQSFLEARSESFQQDDAPTRSADLLKPKIFRRNVLLQSKTLERGEAGSPSQPSGAASRLALPGSTGSLASPAGWPPGCWALLSERPFNNNNKVLQSVPRGKQRHGEKTNRITSDTTSCEVSSEGTGALAAGPLKLACLKSQGALSIVSSQVFLIFQ